MSEGGLNSAQTLFLHGLQSTTTSTQPVTSQSPSESSPDPNSIVWIIVGTLFLFGLSVFAISEGQKRCGEMKPNSFHYRYQGDIDPHHPPTVASICCPCIDLNGTDQKRVHILSSEKKRERRRKGYQKAQVDVESVEADTETILRGKSASQDSEESEETIEMNEISSRREY